MLRCIAISCGSYMSLLTYQISEKYRAEARYLASQHNILRCSTISYVEGRKILCRRMMRVQPFGRRSYSYLVCSIGIRIASPEVFT